MTLFFIFYSCSNLSMNSVFKEEQTYSDSMLFEKEAKEVVSINDEYKPYYIINSDEEPIDDFNITNASECDIKAVAASYDYDQMRFDIFLNYLISKTIKTFFGIHITFKNGHSYMVYHPYKDTLYYYFYDAGGYNVFNNRITMEKTGGYAELKNPSQVTIVYNKLDIFRGTKGNKYTLKVRIISGVLDKDDKIFAADTTIPILVKFRH